eukprot:3830524-Pyramimonas_sp.AAC.1
MDDSQLGRFSGVRKDLGGESNSAVVEWLNRGLMSASSPNLRGSCAPQGRHRGRGEAGVAATRGKHARLLMVFHRFRCSPHAPL